MGSCNREAAEARNPTEGTKLQFWRVSSQSSIHCRPGTLPAHRALAKVGPGALRVFVKPRYTGDGSAEPASQSGHGSRDESFTKGGATLKRELQRWRRIDRNLTQLK